MRMKIGLVCLVARIRRHAILFRSKRMDNANLKSGVGESPLGNQVKVARALHTDDHVFNLVLLLGFSDLGKGEFEKACPMLERTWSNQQLAEIVGHHPFRPILRRVNTNDPEASAPDFGHTGPMIPLGFCRLCRFRDLDFDFRILRWMLVATVMRMLRSGKGKRTYSLSQRQFELGSLPGREFFWICNVIPGALRCS
jgi:hypothetical protein